MAIPEWLTLPAISDYTFGCAAFERWAEVLLNDALWQTTEQCTEESIWNRHCSAFCLMCTSMGAFGGSSRAVDYLNRVREVCPDLMIVSELLPHYERLSELTQQIWEIHEGFMPAPERMQERCYRERIASVLQQMADCCCDILRLFA